MYLRYSSSVVAPMVRNSPRASIGLSMFDASTEPSAAPAPTIVCNSSMNKMIWPCESVTSFKNAFRRSSNSPRNFAPATIAPMSIAINALLFQRIGHIAANDPPRQSLHDCRFTDARIADEYGIIFCATRDYLHNAADFIVASNHRINLSPSCQVGQVAAVFLERLIFTFGILIGDAL